MGDKDQSLVVNTVKNAWNDTKPAIKKSLVAMRNLYSTNIFNANPMRTTKKGYEAAYGEECRRQLENNVRDINDSQCATHGVVFGHYYGVIVEALETGANLFVLAKNNPGYVFAKSVYQNLTNNK